MATHFRGPLKYASTGGTPSPLASPALTGIAQPFLNGAPMEAVDILPVLSTNMPDEGPRTFGYAWSTQTYPGPYAETNPATVEGIVITHTAGTAASAATQAVLGGSIRLTPQVTTDNANAYIANDAAVFQLVAGKRLWFAVRFANPVATVTQGEIFLGLSAATLAADLATAPTAGIFFLKADGASDFSFQVRNAAASTTVSNVFAAAAVTVPAVNVISELGFLVDAGGTPNALTQGAISCYVNGKFAGSVPSTSANLPTVVLKFALGRQNSGANTDTLDLFQCLCIEEV